MRRLLLVGVVLALGLCFSSVAAANTLTVTCAPAAAGGGCDESGAWQLSPVTVTWQASPVPTSVSGCASRTYNDVATTVSCEVWWGPNGTAPSQSISFPLNVETSSPSATATPDRPPDVNGWYNHPVSVTFAGSAFSGISSCTAPQTFAGPATPGTSLSGSCTDNAGKAAGASFPFRYDASPPSLSADSKPADGSVDLSWQASSGPAPLAWVQVARDPGVAAAAASVLYQGAGTSYQDKRVRNGTRYTYTVTAMDQAGNMSQETVSATPGARLLTPARGARLSAPPALRWTAIPKATYYNVQLFKGKVQVLSAWPAKPGLQLKRTWRFRGHRHRLGRGTYKWYVWPGFGARKAAHYGHRIGSATFVIR